MRICGSLPFTRCQPALAPTAHLLLGINWSPRATSVYFSFTCQFSIMVQYVCAALDYLVEALYLIILPIPVRLKKQNKMHCSLFGHQQRILFPGHSPPPPHPPPDQSLSSDMESALGFQFSKPGTMLHFPVTMFLATRLGLFVLF